MIQDIWPHKLNNQYDPQKKAEENSPVFVFQDRKLLIRPTKDGFELPTAGELKTAQAEETLTYLLTLDETALFLLREDEAVDHHPELQKKEFRLIGMKELRSEFGFCRERVFTAITAYQLSNWYNDNRFCGSCGSRTMHSLKERAIQCTCCRRTIYPRIIPAVIVGVVNGDSILLTKYAGRGIHYNALIAGFTEIGETLEETVHREVMEEAGIRVKNLRYYKSQPWGIVDDLLAGFYCEVDGDPTIRLDTTELKEGSWVRREDVILQPDDYSLTNEMMKMFKEGKVYSENG